jgi:hypothetical protein
MALRPTENFKKESHGINTTISTSNVMQNEHPQLHNASTETEGNVNKDEKFVGELNYSALPTCNDDATFLLDLEII